MTNPQSGRNEKGHILKLFSHWGSLGSGTAFVVSIRKSRLRPVRVQSHSSTYHLDNVVKFTRFNERQITCLQVVMYVFYTVFCFVFSVFEFNFAPKLLKNTEPTKHFLRKPTKYFRNLLILQQLISQSKRYIYQNAFQYLVL